MLLFADRTVMNISLAYIGKGFHVGAAALGTTASAFFLLLVAPPPVHPASDGL